MATRPWYNRPLQTAIEAKGPELPIRKPAPKSWFQEGSEFSAVPVCEPVLVARPVVAR